MICKNTGARNHRAPVFFFYSTRSIKLPIFSAALSMLAFGAELIAAAVRGGFDLGANAAHILMAALSALLLIVSAVLAAVANRREDEEEERAMRATSEI